MQLKAACRCGAVAFEVEGEPGNQADRLPVERRQDVRQDARHDVLWSVPRARIRMRAPEPAIGAFTYSGWLVGHRFCAACGMHLFGEEIAEQGEGCAVPMAYVNRECLEATLLPVHPCPDPGEAPSADRDPATVPAVPVAAGYDEADPPAPGSDRPWSRRTS